MLPCFHLLVLVFVCVFTVLVALFASLYLILCICLSVFRLHNKSEYPFT